MSAETMKHLGEKYFRETQSRNGRGGFGLGLHIVRSIIEAHNGTLEISSTLGVGSRFSVNLPGQSDAGESA